MYARRFNARPRREQLVLGNEWRLDQGAPLWPTQAASQDEVVRAVESLPEPYRAVLEMRFWGRMTHQEIAEELGWKDRRWTSVYLKRAKKKLSRLLGGDLPTTP